VQYATGMGLAFRPISLPRRSVFLCLVMPVSRARSIAFDILRRVATQDAYADESLRAALDETVGTADAGLATELTLGVLRWQRLLDFLIDRNLAKKTKTLDIEVRIALRLGIYQLYFLERVPAHAAVHESVELVKQARKRSAAPLVNAVLRKSAKESSTTPKPTEAIASLIPRDLPRTELLGIEHSQPTWLVERWMRTIGEDRTVALLGANNRVPGLSAFIVNPQRREEAIASLQQVGCEVRPGLLLRDAWTLHGGNPAASAAMRNGWTAIQDEGSQAVAHLLSVASGNTVLDLCAAPGGKTLLLSLAAGAQGHVIAADLHGHRVRAMAERFERTGIRNIASVAVDGTQPLPFGHTFDRILVDAPCSGTGTLARHPEIRWRLRAENLAELHALQAGLLRNALTALAPSGRLVYSTCSLEPEENEFVVNEVLGDTLIKFRVVTSKAVLQQVLREDIVPEHFIGTDGFFRTFPPQDGTDGFFAAVIEHKSENL
jgi:16S rRNA (cytosine967-C5)-methyltransferase